MLRSFRWFSKQKNRNSYPISVHNVQQWPSKTAMGEVIQEIAIYIHRFHNLDLFQQGLYQLKITMRWEDGNQTSPATPARVVQYGGSDDVMGIWKIDDTDNSFSTQPFRIKYAKQDILLCVMISFNLSLTKFEGPPNCGAILKFELLFAPILENRSSLLTGSDMWKSLDSCPTAVHEFRIPPKALLGLHSYCPVHFDSFHSVLVDTSIHTCLLKVGFNSPFLKDEIPVIFADSKLVNLLKALLDVNNLLFEEIQKLCIGIGQKIDLDSSASILDTSKLFESSELGLGAIEDADEIIGFHADAVVLSLPRESLLNAFHFVGNQILYLWNTFLKFHRANKSKTIEFLHDEWARERRAEWSIWMVYSKVEMPHHYLFSGMNETSFHGFGRKVSILGKINFDPAQISAMRADLRRRSISQMKINNRSIQDMCIFRDPSRVPVIVVEHVVNSSQHPTSGNLYLNSKEPSGKLIPVNKADVENISLLHGASSEESGSVLKIVVFVHGFQGHHLDLRLVRNQWLLLDSKVEFLMSEANENRTTGDFREMGLRLAQEVISFIKKKTDKVSRSGTVKSIKLSFVGHSIGNVIIRTALAENIMEPFLPYLHTYCSMSGPHLGYLYSSNALFNSGLWILKKLKGTQCINQLTLADDPDLENTFFYKLCKQKTLENFRNVILMSSPQDGYVPYHSARIEMCQASSQDYTKRGKVFLEMLNSCLDQIRVVHRSKKRVFIRCDINFDTSVHGRSLNSFIGRTAHIEFLESDIFAKFIMWSLPHLFR